MYGKINRGQVSRPLYRGCPLFGGSVIRGFALCMYRSSGPRSNSIGAHCCSLAHNMLCENVGKKFGKDA